MMQDWPYVIVTPNVQAPCTDWGYSGNVDVNDVQGCVQFMNTQPLSATAPWRLRNGHGVAPTRQCFSHNGSDVANSKDTIIQPICALSASEPHELCSSHRTA